MKESFLCRQRKFHPRNFFLSILNLAVSTNGDGYPTALLRAWDQCGLSKLKVPWKSSLCEYRQKISFHFFRDLWREDLQRLKPSRRKFAGFYIYSVDGDDLDLPATEDVLGNGYRGYRFSKDKETYYPKMYTVQAMDVMNGLVVDFAESCKKQEVILAREMVKNFEQNSIAIYDRLHGSYQTALQHFESKNYFLIRVKDKNPTNPIEIKEFCRSKKRSKWIDLKPSQNEQKKKKDFQTLRVRLIKVRNPKSKEDIVFMTNLKESKFTNEEIGQLYRARWEVEISFRDQTSSALRLNQWHSRKINGILQEIYALFWLINQIKIQLLRVVRKIDWFHKTYQKANFKVCVGLVMDHMDLLAQGKSKQLQRVLVHWIKRTTEKRQRLSRSYPRQTKRYGRKYLNASSVNKRP